MVPGRDRERMLAESVREVLAVNTAEKACPRWNSAHPRLHPNLEALKAIGAVADVNPLHEEARYEAALPGSGAGRPHHHLVYTSCKKVRDLHDGELDGLRVRHAQGFEVRAIRVQAEGLCPDCR